MQECVLFDTLPQDRVRCRVCQIRCVISRDRAGVCRSRVNRGGVLYSTIYGLVSTTVVEPVEKKPLFHFQPGARILCLGSVSCNFGCPGCQTASISRTWGEVPEAPRVPVLPELFGPGPSLDELEPMSPAESVELALMHGADGIAWTFNEPTIWFEHALESARLAKEAGLATLFITNGLITREALGVIAPYLDAFRVDLKGFSRDAFRSLTGLARFEGILEVTELARHQHGLWVECVTNVTPSLNDSDDNLRSTARWIARRLGPDTPWHLTRFVPFGGLNDLPATPLSTLERAHRIAREEGLSFVYIGNVPGHVGQNTFCPGCGRVVVARRGFTLRSSTLTPDGRCRGCSYRLPGVFAAATPGRFPGRARRRAEAPPLKP